MLLIILNEKLKGLKETKNQNGRSLLGWVFRTVKEKRKKYIQTEYRRNC